MADLESKLIPTRHTCARLTVSEEHPANAVKYEKHDEEDKACSPGFWQYITVIAVAHFISNSLAYKVLFWYRQVDVREERLTFREHLAVSMSASLCAQVSWLFYKNWRQKRNRRSKAAARTLDDEVTKI